MFFILNLMQRGQFVRNFLGRTQLHPRHHYQRSRFRFKSVLAARFVLNISSLVYQLIFFLIGDILVSR
jgi:hypothetical protein